MNHKLGDKLFTFRYDFFVNFVMKKPLFNLFKYNYNLISDASMYTTFVFH